MPVTRYTAEAFGVLTICLVALLILLGLVCIAYSFYLRSRVLRQGFIQLSYFSGPWIIRIAFILLAIWWGLGEIIRINFLRRQGRVLNALNFKWQENVCKCYIVSNLGFAEPCLFLTLVFLLRAPLQNTETGILSRKWNGKTAGYVLLYCLPMFVLQLILVLIGPQLRKDRRELPQYFTRAVFPGMQNSDTIALSLAFSAFLVLLCCAGVCICILVYCPVADCLALGNLHDFEARRRVVFDDQNDTVSLINNQSHLEGTVGISPERNSDASTKRGSISFRTYQRDDTSTGAFVELSLFSPSRDVTPPGSPPLMGWPMRPLEHFNGT
ncbi:hypothetical protein PTKIN_Ptkin02bG0249200 [Pterospermum kingtungense]